MEVPSVMVHRVERHPTRLYGTFAERPRCSVDIKDSQHRTIRPTLDSASGIVDGVAAIGELGHIDRYYALQRPRFVTNAPLQSLRGRFATRCISGRLHDASPCPLADATKYEWGASVAGVCTRGDTKIQKAAHRPFRPVRVMSAAVGELPVLTIQDQADVVGASVIDCRPPVLPVSIPLGALSPTTIEKARGTSAFNPSHTEGQSIMDMDTNEITINLNRGFPVE